MNIKNLRKNISNFFGWRTNRKIVVIESDDWGSLRMSSQQAYSSLSKKGITLDKGAGARYNAYDTLASESDLEHLFEVLKTVKDKNENYAKITAVSVVANPDFDKIRKNKFAQYYYEPFTETLSRYGRENAFILWKQGKQENIFFPEFHGREHLNVQFWLRALQQKDKETLLAFDEEVWGFTRKEGKGFQAAFDIEYLSDLEQQKNILSTGLKLFYDLHGYSAKFFVPPNGHINNSLEKVAASAGVMYISTPKIQQEVLGEGRIKKHFRYLGKRNIYDQIYITRNAFFEPSGAKNDQINSCLREIEIAFKFKKPAIISSHRVNYIGSLDEKNRLNSLKQLSQLLKNIIVKWPEVEFMSSSEMGKIISET